MAKRSQLPRVEKQRGPSRRGGPAEVKKSRRRRLLLLTAVVAAVLVIVVGVILLQAQTARRPVEVSGETGEGSAWGPEGADVLITEYSDFGCSHCRNFALGAGKQLREEYEGGGRVRFEFKHFIISPPDTANAANAAECAADQGRFWDYHDVLYSQQGVARNPFAKANLKQYARRLGLDAAVFDQCVDRDAHLEEVYRQSTEGRNAGVEGTPTFFVNGQKLVGDLPYADFKAVVDAALTQ